MVDSVAIEGVERINAVFGLNPFETEEATDAYLAEHDHAPYKTLASILLTGRVTPWRARGMAELLGKTTRDPGYLEYLLARDRIRQNVLGAMAEHDLDALEHATFDHPPTLIAHDAETNPAPADDYGLGDNRLNERSRIVKSRMRGGDDSGVAAGAVSVLKKFGVGPHSHL